MNQVKIIKLLKMYEEMKDIAKQAKAKLIEVLKSNAFDNCINKYSISGDYETINFEAFGYSFVIYSSASFGTRDGEKVIRWGHISSYFHNPEARLPAEPSIHVHLVHEDIDNFDALAFLSRTIITFLSEFDKLDISTLMLR